MNTSTAVRTETREPIARREYVVVDRTILLRPDVATRVRQHVVARPLLLQCAVCLGIGAAVFTASTLVGFVTLEKYRVEAQAATQRASAAENLTSSMRDDVEALSGPGAVRRWAAQRGLVAPDWMAQTSESESHRAAD